MKRWLGLVVVMVGCSQPATPARPMGQGFEVIDLSPLIDEASSLKVEPVVTEKPIFLAMANVTVFNHAGSHYDPPGHVIKGGATAEAVSVDKLVGPARVLDLRDRPRGKPLGRADFDGKVKSGEFVVAFVGCRPDDTCAFLGKDAAEYLASVPVRAFGTDMWTLSNPNRFGDFKAAMEAGKEGTVDEWVPEHFALLSRDVPVFEGLTNLEPLLAARDATIVALPLKIKGGNGAPARVVALVPR